MRFLLKHLKKCLKQHKKDKIVSNKRNLPFSVVVDISDPYSIGKAVVDILGCLADHLSEEEREDVKQIK